MKIIDNNIIINFCRGVIILSSLFSCQVLAVLLSVVFTDPEGDWDAISSGFPQDNDLKSIELTFDNASGDYEIFLSSYVVNQFKGPLTVNVNLFNGDVGTTAQVPSFFSDVLNSVFFPESTESFSLYGNSPRLMSWKAGDRVTPSSGFLGNPEGILGFGTEIRNYDFIHGVSVIHAVPLPPTWLLMLSGLLLSRLSVMKCNRRINRIY